MAMGIALDWRDARILGCWEWMHGMLDALDARMPGCWIPRWMLDAGCWMSGWPML